MTIVVLAPHPDDEAIGCGGLLRLAADLGTRTVIAYLTSGQAGIPGCSAAEAARIREKEAEAAASVLGIARLVFLRARDAELAADGPAIAPRLAALLGEEAPTDIYLPHPEDEHRDHRAVAPLLRHCLPAFLDPVLHGFEIWSPLVWPEEVVDISAVIDAKLTAIRCHASQVGTLRYDLAAEGLAAYRGALAGGCRYAEAFSFVIQAPRAADEIR